MGRRSGHDATVTRAPDPSPDDAPDGQPRSTPGGSERSTEVDPVLVRRRQVARLADAGQRLGYALFALATALFVVGFVTGFSPGITTTVIVALAAGSALLAPAIVAGYAVKAADRDDRERGISA
jgi:hypothetical protein